MVSVSAELSAIHLCGRETALHGSVTVGGSENGETVTEREGAGMTAAVSCAIVGELNLKACLGDKGRTLSLIHLYMAVTACE